MEEIGHRLAGDRPIHTGGAALPTTAATAITALTRPLRDCAAIRARHAPDIDKKCARGRQVSLPKTLCR